MRMNCIRNVAERTILHPSQRRFVSNPGACDESPFLSNLPKCGAHTLSPFRSTKARVSGAIDSFYHSYSTIPSPSSDRKVGLLAWYLGMLKSRPIITKGVSACLIYAAADLTSQGIMQHSSGAMDLIRTLRMASYGLLILGPSQHMWFNLAARVLPKQDLVTTLKKLLIGQLIYGPIITSMFFSYNATLQGESGSDIAARLKRDLIPTLKNGLVYWPLCDFLTYKAFPVHLQPLLNSSFAFLWTIYLTYMASLKKPEDY